jgi:hypothetical protein
MSTRRLQYRYREAVVVVLGRDVPDLLNPDLLDDLTIRRVITVSTRRASLADTGESRR